MEKNTKNTYTITKEGSAGSVKIADEVVAVIAGIAAMEVDGVASMVGNATKDIMQKLGRKSLSKGVKIEIQDNVVKVHLALNIKYGNNIMEITKNVQEKVKTAIENMTGLSVADVNVRVAGVNVSEEQ
ncbi:Asp23/Gls24 family envelope stress response protein [Ohessyouella blattaphilus]|uniref:Asp23/Gls24 family envelope stress response protein n=1 Tax=Ohessyouella blattaphilus TaxID=2949333 RepID=A0ABT1EKJ2_9FIRM|nr:Asp23/Gls24 family envelope stress response protein [Ohessyouella blattaphilus]MCP1111221.1 Asp23/Gls24 family envelope stress response protein [Ohessyouella blattaphilus]MCR8564615.1 Asp23/Gls24 family envelope stress response protein [Ohessyouella blattaphilus]